MRIRIWISLLLIWSVQLVQAQFHQEGQRVELLLSNGKSVKGTITEHTDTQISIQSRKATRTYEKSDIKHINYIGTMESTALESESKTIAMQDYQMIAPNALAAKEGLSYRNISLLANQFSYGFNENWTLQFGFELFTIIVDSDVDSPILYLAPKYSFSLADQWTAAISVASFKWEDEFAFAPLAILSYGNTKHNVSAGIGSGYNDSDNESIYYLAFTTTMNNRISFLGEVYLQPRFYSVGVRIRLGKASSLDLTYVPGASIPIPTLSLAF